MTPPLRVTVVRARAAGPRRELWMAAFTACAFLLLSTGWLWNAFHAFTELGAEGDGWKDLLQAALCLVFGLYLGREWRRMAKARKAAQGTTR